MKKILLVLLISILGINLSTNASDFSSIVNGHTLYFNITSNTYPYTVAIASQNPSYPFYSILPSGSVIIPETVSNGGNVYSVTSISNNTFRSCSSLTSITIPNSVTSIGEFAFYDCYLLPSVIIPSSVTSIGMAAFSGCSSFTSITIPNSVTSIGEYAFAYCTNLISINIPSSVTLIKDGTFRGCSVLPSIALPGSITSIGENAFYDCYAFTSINIPSSVTSIGHHAFYNCYTLPSIIIPNSVTSIGEFAFAQCSALTSINIPNTITSIAKATFASCFTLPSITIPNSVTSIGESAFSSCYALPSITIPNTVTSIGNLAFAYCTSFTSITIPSSITIIPNGAFGYCSSLTSISIPSSVTSIANNAFASCSSLPSIAIPNTVTSIGNYAFAYCSSLTSITLPEFITSIEPFTFQNCTALTSIIIPNYVTSIKGIAFSGCTALTSIVIPNSVTSIGNDVFNGCSALTSITLPNNLTSIAGYAFIGCTSLISITSHSLIPPIILSTTFSGIPKTIPLYVPLISIPTYQSAPNWNAFTNYQYIGAPQMINVSICEGEVYTNYGANADSAGTYYLFNNDGDSIILNLTVNPNYDTTINAGICQGSTYSQNGFNESIGGTYTQNLQTINGCDSIINLNLYYYPSYEDTITASICQGEVYQGFIAYHYYPNYTGVFTVELLTVDGCDSIVHLNLTVHPTYHDTIIASICQGESYILNGFNQSAAGTYTRNLQTIYGCDSIVTLKLFVNPIYSASYNATICEGNTYNLNGFNESTAGTYTQNLQTVNGCDSIINLNLIVNPSYDTVIIASICSGETYTLNGFNTSSSGSNIQFQQTINGCDSILYLNLIVNPTYNNTINATICQGQTYTLNGFNASTTGIHTQNLQTTKGCDSIVNLNLNVNPVYNNTINATICQGETYTLNGFNASTTGIHTQNLQTTKGCDSIVNLNLIVNPTYKDTINATICQGQTYTLNGFNASTTGIHTQNLQTTKGCDSIVNLNLIVNPTYTDTIRATICEGEVYTEFGIYMLYPSLTGIYSITLQTANGCDSIINLDLKVNPVYKDTITATICQGTTYTLYGFNESIAGTYTQNLQTVNSCDSLITLNLIVNQVTTPTNLVLDNNQNHFELSWQSDAENYIIYRNNDSIATTTNTIFIDTNVIDGTNYCYKVKANTGECEAESIEICQVFTGLNDIIDNPISITLYPNPTSSSSRLEIENVEGNIEITITDISGRKIQTMSTRANNKLETTIDLSNHSKGIYFITIITEKTKRTEKLILK